MGSKMIVVKSKGYVDTSRGPRVYAPISRPYREKTDVILRMITVSKAEVYEVLPDKTEVRLDVTNYDKDNYVIKNNIKCEASKIKPISEPQESEEVSIRETPLFGGSPSEPVEETSMPADDIPTAGLGATTRQFDPLTPDYGVSLIRTLKFMEHLSDDNEESSEHGTDAQEPEPITEGDVLEEVSDQDMSVESDVQSNESWKQNKRNKKRDKH